jgi:anion-transporting  ArsA/GET3 family ATPase
LPTTTLNDLLQRRTLIVLGKGGVGKTAVSAAIALMSANRGERVLAMECDSRAPMASMFGAEHSFEPVSVAPNLSVMILDGRHSLEEYLHLVLPGRALLNAVFASRLYQYFVQAAPGLRELMMLGKLYYEVEQNPRSRAMWKRVILDAPASGQALSLLRMPEAAHETFGESIVGREANSVARMLRDESECAILQVTTPDPLSLTETLETYSALEAMGLKVAAVILNRRNPVAFDSEDLARFARNQTLRRKLKTMDHLCDLARAELERAAVSRRALTQLRERLQSPIIELQDHRGLSGLDLVKALALELSQQSESAADLPN